MVQNRAMKIDARNGGDTVYRRILAVGLLLAVGPARAIGQSAGPPPDPCPDLTKALQPVTTLPIASCGDAMPQGNFVRSNQVPPAPQNGQFVYGTLDFSTDGKSPEYRVQTNWTRVEEEHSLWCLQYYRTASQLRTNAKQWFHRTMDTVVDFSGGPNTKVVTLKTITLVGNIPPVGSATLTIANLRGADGSTDRGLTMSSGVSLPQIVVQEVNRQFNFPQGGGACQEVSKPGGVQKHPMTAFLQIDDQWMWGLWTSPYSGKIGTTNNYPTYVLKPPPGAPKGAKGTPWLTVDAMWNTQP